MELTGTQVAMGKLTPELVAVVNEHQRLKDELAKHERAVRYAKRKLGQHYDVLYDAMPDDCDNFIPGCRVFDYTGAVRELMLQPEHVVRRIPFHLEQR